MGQARPFIFLRPVVRSTGLVLDGPGGPKTGRPSGLLKNDFNFVRK